MCVVNGFAMASTRRPGTHEKSTVNKRDEMINSGIDARMSGTGERQIQINGYIDCCLLNLLTV